MLTGKPLGAALAEAMRLKGVGPTEVAREFEIKPPSVYDWRDHGRIGKKHLGHLVAYFADVVPAAHWGIGDLPEMTHAPVSILATPPGYVRVEQLDVEGGMGNERINADVPDVIRSVEYSDAYIRALVGFVPAPGRLMLVTGRGDSMRPTIEPGETVLVDTGCDAFDGDGLYLVNSGNGQQIKRLQDRAGVVFIVSDNTFYAAVPATEKTRVSGRVHLIQHLERVS